MIIFLR